MQVPAMTREGSHFMVHTRRRNWCNHSKLRLESKSCLTVNLFTCLMKTATKIFVSSSRILPQLNCQVLKDVNGIAMAASICLHGSPVLKSRLLLRRLIHQSTSRDFVFGSQV